MFYLLINLCMTVKKKLRKYLRLIVTFFFVTIVPILSSFISDFYVADIENRFFWLLLHHLSQLLLTVFVIRIILKKNLKDWGFNFSDKKKSLTIFAYFSWIYLIPVFFINIYPYLFNDKLPSLPYSFTLENVSSELVFQFLISGSCEEPLFRAMVIHHLSQYWGRKYKFFGFDISQAGIWSVIFFTIAHIQIDYSSFKIISFSIEQLEWAFFLGLYYAIVYEKTKSLLAVILSHNYSNGIVIISSYIIILLK